MSFKRDRLFLFFVLFAILFFARQNTLAQPALYDPNNGATNVPLPVYFDWSGESGAIQFQLQVDNQSNFSSPEVDITTAGTDYTADGLNMLTTYYWRVRSFYSGPPYISGWSSVWSFTTECTTPGRPQLVFPPDNSNLEINAPVTFDWNSISGAVNYQIQIDNSSDFGSPHVDQTTTNTYLAVSDFVYNNTNFWRVRADYGSGCEWGTWSYTWDFLPACGAQSTALLSPGNDAVITEDVSEVKMDWSTVGDAEYYHLIVGSYAGGNNIFDDTVSTSHFWLTVQNFGDYYWRVRSHNGLCYSDWTDIWHYTICYWPPPTPLVPADGATDVEIRPLFLDWEDEESVQSYKLQVDDNSDFSSPQIDVTTSSSSYSSSNDADYSTTYFWRVSAYTSNDCAGWSDWSATRSFTTECFDYDEDNVCFEIDNCQWDYNPSQTDSDGDGFGDECDECAGHDDNVDTDEDSVPDGCDNCPSLSNGDQADNDLDGQGDLCDGDDDDDGISDEADNCQFMSNSGQEDNDADNVGNVCDNCPDDYNPDQLDLDEDGIGYVCDDNVFAGAVILDGVEGLYSGDTVLAGSPVRFTFRLIYNPGDGSNVSTFQNSFRLWTHRNGSFSDGFQPITYDTLPVNWLGMFDLVISMIPYGVDGLDEDTVGFYGSSMFNDGFPDSFNEPVWWIETTPLNPGDTICIDRRADYMTVSSWFWISNGIWYYFIPLWPGPYCFAVVDPDLMYICGDANGEGTVNILDITFLIAYLYKGGPAPEPLEAADVNNSGNVNILDITYLISYLYKSGPAPVCP